jgi:hypothetical protein
MYHFFAVLIEKKACVHVPTLTADCGVACWCPVCVAQLMADEVMHLQGQKHEIERLLADTESKLQNL